MNNITIVDDERVDRIFEKIYSMFKEEAISYTEAFGIVKQLEMEIEEKWHEDLLGEKNG